MLAQSGLSLGQVDWVVCHQANGRIIDHCVRALKADPEKFYKNMDRHGNTSAASIQWLSTSWRKPATLSPARLWPALALGRADLGADVVPI